MGRYIEQLKNFQTRGGDAAKPTELPAKRDGVMSVLAPGDTPVSKISHWCQLISNRNTAAEYFATMREFRVTNPTTSEVTSVYRIAGLKLSALKGGGAHLQEEIDRRRQEGAGGSPKAVLSAPLSISQARAIKRKYGQDGTVWERFWIWAGRQVEGGADAVFIEESERAMMLACEECTVNHEE